MNFNIDAIRNELTTMSSKRSKGTGGVTSEESKDFAKIEDGDNYFKVVPFSDGWFAEKGTHFFNFDGNMDPAFPPLPCYRVNTKHVSCPFCDAIYRLKDFSEDIAKARTSVKYIMNVVALSYDEENDVFTPKRTGTPFFVDFGKSIFDFLFKWMSSKQVGIEKILFPTGKILIVTKTVGASKMLTKYTPAFYQGENPNINWTEEECNTIYSNARNPRTLSHFQVPNAEKMEEIKSRCLEWVGRFSGASEMLSKSMTFSKTVPPVSKPVTSLPVSVGDFQKKNEPLANTGVNGKLFYVFDKESGKSLLLPLSSIIEKYHDPSTKVMPKDTVTKKWVDLSVFLPKSNEDVAEDPPLPPDVSEEPVQSASLKQSFDFDDSPKESDSVASFNIPTGAPDCYGIAHDGSTQKCKLCEHEFTCEEICNKSAGV